MDIGIGFNGMCEVPFDPFCRMSNKGRHCSRWSALAHCNSQSFCLLYLRYFWSLWEDLDCLSVVNQHIVLQNRYMACHCRAPDWWSIYGSDCFCWEVVITSDSWLTVVWWYPSGENVLKVTSYIARPRTNWFAWPLVYLQYFCLFEAP